MCPLWEKWNNMTQHVRATASRTYEEIPLHFLTCEFHFLAENGEALEPDRVKGSSPQLCIVLILFQLGPSIYPYKSSTWFLSSRFPDYKFYNSVQACVSQIISFPLDEEDHGSPHYAVLPDSSHLPRIRPMRSSAPYSRFITPFTTTNFMCTILSILPHTLTITLKRFGIH